MNRILNISKMETTTSANVPYYAKPGRKLEGKSYEGTARVNASVARVDQLKELLRSTAPQVDVERVMIMKEVYEATEGYPNVIRRANFFAELLDRKKIYIDDNLLVGSMAGSLNAIYTYPEWQVGWMIEENTVEKSKTPEEREINQWVLDYWGKRAQVPRVLEIYEKRYGVDPTSDL